MRPREDPVRHVIVGLWLILVRMSASVHASESKPTPFLCLRGPRSLSLGDARLRGGSLRRLARAAGAQRERVCQRTTIGELASERNRRDGPLPSVGATQTSDAADEGRWMA